MNILIIGSGGREHAIAWKVAQSALASQIYVAPGNVGTASENKIENIAISATDIEKLVEFAQQKEIGLTIIGPEAPLVAGIVDAFKEKGLTILGPTQMAAQLEGSKTFAKDFLARHAIPTAEYQNFTEIKPALDYIKQRKVPIVIKANGLAAGKGVVVAMTELEAQQAVKDMLSGNAFGDAGSSIVIEEFLEGEEASFIVLADGKNVVPMATSQDHKRAGENDTGPNTGGMGAYSPAPVVSQEIHDRIMQQIIYPTIKGMHAEGMTYTGFLYAGLMIMPDGQVKVIEFNCRLGDPETQPIMLRLESDIVEMCLAACRGELDRIKLKWNTQIAMGIVLAAEGYPNNYRKNDEITGAIGNDNSQQKIFLAGVTQKDSKLFTNGGRVLCVTSLGNSVTEAQQNALKMAQQVNWQGRFYRRDIGYRAIAREKISK